MQVSRSAATGRQALHSRASQPVGHCLRGPGAQRQRSSVQASLVRAPAAAVPSAGTLRRPQQQRQLLSQPAASAHSRIVFCRATEAKEQVPVTLPRTGSFLSKTEVPAFIPRDDMMDQLLRWALIEAEEGGQRNFGLPMKVHQRFRDGDLWGMDVEIIKEGVKVCDLSVGFDADLAYKAEWIGQDANGFPTKEGKQEEVAGKHFEIWKTCDKPVDEDLRAAIRAFCTGLVSALNKYYAFGSVFAEEV